jgi:antibiotic biosynthesis monooxygenase (ABM) superfamily enzyme
VDQHGTVSAVAPREPVTVVVTRRARAGREDALESWLHDVIAATAGFEGYQGSTVLRPAPGAPGEHVLVFRFASFEDLRRWQTSEVRAAFLAKAEAFTEAVEIRTQQGLEPFFDLPARRGLGEASPPPRWKMAVLTWLGLYPTVLAVGLLMHPLLARQPFALASVPQTLASVVLMTWVVMPRLTRLVSRWLYPTR